MHYQPVLCLCVSPVRCFVCVAVNMRGQGRVSMKDFELLRVLGTGAYGKVFLTRKISGPDKGKLYALKQLKKASIVHKSKTTEHTITERQVLESIRDSPFLVTLHYAFQTDSKLNLILGKWQISLYVPLSACMTVKLAFSHPEVTL